MRLQWLIPGAFAIIKNTPSEKKSKNPSGIARRRLYINLTFLFSLGAARESRNAQLRQHTKAFVEAETEEEGAGAREREKAKGKGEGGSGREGERGREGEGATHSRHASRRPQVKGTGGAPKLGLTLRLVLRRLPL